MRFSVPIREADIRRLGSNVRFVPIATIRTATKGLYSITSLARANSDGGTSRPSVLAVFKLIASSYLTGACTGRYRPASRP